MRLGRWIDEMCMTHPELMDEVRQSRFGTAAWFVTDGGRVVRGCFVGTIAICAMRRAGNVPCGDVRYMLGHLEGITGYSYHTLSLLGHRVTVIQRRRFSGVIRKWYFRRLLRRRIARRLQTAPEAVVVPTVGRPAHARVEG